MRADILTVIEAAEIRQEQWERIGNGAPVHEVVEELHEVAGTLAGSWSDDRENEAQSIAEEQGAAIHAVRESLPACASSASLDTLASNAMCIWEHVLETQRTWKRHDTEEEPLHWWIAAGEGAFSARDGCWALAGLAEEAWKSILDEYDEAPYGFEAFDWSFVPAWIDALHDICTSGGNITFPAEVSREQALKAAAAAIEGRQYSNVSTD